jgi:hypothetical protein
MSRTVKEYRFNGLAGCVTQWTCRATGTLVGLYHSMQAEMESDPELPWSTVCEVHGTLVSHTNLRNARFTRDPTDFCDDCREVSDTKEKS